MGKFVAENSECMTRFEGIKTEHRVQIGSCKCYSECMTRFEGIKTFGCLDRLFQDRASECMTRFEGIKTIRAAVQADRRALL